MIGEKVQISDFWRRGMIDEEDDFPPFDYTFDPFPRFGFANPHPSIHRTHLGWSANRRESPPERPCSTLASGPLESVRNSLPRSHPDTRNDSVVAVPDWCTRRRSCRADRGIRCDRRSPCRRATLRDLRHNYIEWWTQSRYLELNTRDKHSQKMNDSDGRLR